MTHVAMKNLTKILFSCVLLVSLFVKPSTSTFAITMFAGGDGTLLNPYLIETAEQLSAIRADLNAVYALISDVDLSDLTGSFDNLNPLYNNGEGWLPIGSDEEPFRGVLDGRGFKISGLAIKISNEQEKVLMGLFGVLEDAFIYNFDLEGKLDSTAQSDMNAGMLAYSAYNSIISGVRVYGTIDSTSTQSGNVGGFFGSITDNVLYNLESHVLITTLTEGSIGGFVGESVNSQLRNVIYRGEIHALRATQVGGIVGYLENSRVHYAQNYGYVNAYDIVGGIVGYALNSDIMVVINYANVKTQTYHAGGIAGLVKYYANESSVSYYNLDFLANYGFVTSNLNDPAIRLGSMFAKMDFEVSIEDDHIVIRDFFDFAGELPLVSTIEDLANTHQFRIIFDGYRLTGNEYTLDKNSPYKGLVIVVNEFIMLDPNFLEDIVDGLNYSTYNVLEASLENGVIFIDFAQTYYFTQGKVSSPLSEDISYFNTFVFEALPSTSYGVLSFSDFESLSGWDFTSMVGWNSERDDSGVLFVEGDELNYVRGVAFVRVYATDGIVVDDDNDDDGDDNGDDDGDDEELPPTSDASSWSWILLALGYLGIHHTKKKS